MTTEKEAADEARESHEHRHDQDEWEVEATRAKVRPSRSAVVSVRLPREEMTTLETAADAAGETLSEYIRKAIICRLGGATPLTASVVNRSVGYANFNTQTDDWTVSNRPSDVPEVSERRLRTRPS
ncbi:MAG: plasmid mobilization protein [Ktedonobacterales bacterium]